MDYNVIYYEMECMLTFYTVNQHNQYFYLIIIMLHLELPWSSLSSSSNPY